MIVASNENVTLHQVAKKAGVSKSTVSRVINGSASVSPEAKERIEAVIDELGYVPNRAARSLASRRAQAVALVIPEDTTRFFGDPFFAAVISGIDEYLRGTDLVLNLLIASTEDRQKMLSYLTGGNADGALVLSHHTSDRFVQILEEHLPVVYGGLPLSGASSKRFVDVDNFDGAKTATNHLINTGHSRIATISGPSTMPSGRDRLQGYLKAIEEAGLEPTCEEGDFTARSGGEAMRRLLASGAKFDGLFVASDLMARGAMEVLAVEGIKVPEDVAIVGFDDSPVAVQGPPLLTTMRQPSAEQGRLMAKMLLDILDGKDNDQAVILPTELVVRDTCPDLRSVS